ncbi:cellulose synthase complex periplasmic endoglucanase BcsZ [Photobacterium indicum]|uniref:cellulose synthase complex periplasmic endoglucanase BcsZ n=1 Tax=Photobacterium indicum TaxID=81447 RepID=UPI003D0B23D9
MKKLVLIIGFIFSYQVNASTCSWPEWEQFKSTYIQNGRVIDGSDTRQITTSEGQSYGLFFALVANDPTTFKAMLNWTETHLAGGDLTARLPAWLWGKNDLNTFGVLDNNPASDSDLWIAYSLIEAGRLWGEYYYESLGYLLASRILREETREVEGIGTVLLPGRKGFDNGKGQLRLNPSYVPLFLIKNMASHYPNDQWQSLYNSSYTMLEKTMPKGFSPDWVTLSNTMFYADAETGPIGSYNAIRTYLWVGMLNDKTEKKLTLLSMMSPMVNAIKQLQAPPRSVNTETGTFKEGGSAGFSAALLPLLQSLGEKELAIEQAKLVSISLHSNSNDYYYDNVLALFGMGWYQGKYQFGVNGELQPFWVEQCQ